MNRELDGRKERKERNEVKIKDDQTNLGGWRKDG